MVFFVKIILYEFKTTQILILSVYQCRFLSFPPTGSETARVGAEVNNLSLPARFKHTTNS